MRPNLRRPEFTSDLAKMFARRKKTRRKVLLEKGFESAWEIPTIRSKALLPSQQKIPVTNNLGSTLGIREGEKIIMFAGYVGDWAKALSKTTRLTYTDINQGISDFVKKHKKGSIGKFKTIAGESIPQRPNVYDWSFSYEPIPLIGQGTLRITLARSLLNIKGGKLVFSHEFRHCAKEAFEGNAKKLESVYGAKVDLEQVEINSHDPNKLNFKNPKKRKFSLITIRTNDKIRKQVFLDLRILNAVDKAIFYGQSLTISQIAKRFRVSKIEAIRSISRLEDLLEQKQKGLLYRVISIHV